MNGDNIETKFILNTLEQIISLSNEELIKSILEIDTNINCSKNYDLLRRIHKSVGQYLEKKRDLVYIGFMGHFSSGKSSTINSLLSLSGTKAREVDLHPSDKGISLITHTINEPFFIKLVSYGNIPVKPVIIDHDFLKNIVFIDTPGAGDTDPLFVNELMQDYLPICDIILYFVSSTNPLDKNDLPLLKAKHENLSLIPTKFIITRADEFRNDFDKAISDNNFNKSEAEKFIIKAKARIDESIDLFKISIEDFFIIDNKKMFQISELLKFIEDLSANDNFENKLKMHEYKIALFRKTGIKIKDYFSDHAHNKFKTLNKYVTDANNNILRYDDKVRITNNRLTESWKNYQTEIERIKNKNIKDLEEAFIDQLPQSLWETHSQINLLNDINENFSYFKSTSIKSYSANFANQIIEIINPQIRNIENEIESIRIGKFDSINCHIDDFKIEETPTININFPYLIEKDLNKIQFELKNSTKDLIFSLKSNSKSLSYRLINFHPLTQLSDLITNANDQLNIDIDSHFEHVYLYRAGVFSEHVKEYITKLGIGNKLNQLEKEFKETFKDSIKAKAKEIIFPDFENIKKSYENTLRDLKKEFDENNLYLSSIDISNVDFETIDIHSKIHDDSIDLKEKILSSINNRIKTTFKEIVNEIEECVKGIQKEFKRSTSALRRRRLIRLSLFIGIPAMLVFLYLYFDFLNLIPNIAHSFLIGLAANIVVTVISFLIGFLTDNYPNIIESRNTDFKEQSIKESSEILKNKLQDFRECTDEFDIIEKQLKETLNKQIVDVKKQKFSEYIESIYLNLVKIHSTDVEIRKKYIDQITAISLRFNQYFEYDENKLEKISNDIKKEAIEPSFQFLENLREDITKVYNDIDNVSFIQ